MSTSTVSYYIEKYIQTPPHERKDDRVYHHYLTTRTWNAVFHGIICFLDPKWKWNDDNIKEAEQIMATPESLCDFLYKNTIDVYVMKWVGKKAVKELSDLFRTIYT